MITSDTSETPDTSDTRAALAAVDAALSVGDSNRATSLAAESQEPRFRLRWAMATMASGDEPVDEAIMAFLSCIEASELSPAERFFARGALIDGYSRKRVRSLAQQAIAQADAALADLPNETGETDEGSRSAEAALIEVARGRFYLCFDERPEALGAFSKALELAPGHVEATLALSDLHYILGEFDQSVGHLEPVIAQAAERTSLLGDPTDATAAQWARACRLLASIHAASGAREDEVVVWRALVGKDGLETSSNDKLSLVFACAAAGDYESAESELRAIHEEDADSGIGRYARKRLDYLGALESQAAPVKRLKQFPTTAQKHNYCGPAVLELCLSFLELELTQDEIADVVKREHGTPMFEICAYLASHGIITRRIEASPAKIRSAIDLGLPVIVQEEYSNTSHVAVVTGYDARLGVFISNDPATHRPMVKAFEWTERSSDLFGNGGVLVLGRDNDEQTKELASRADELELVEEQHLVLLDSADRQRDQLESDRGPDVANHEVLRICDEAIDMDRSFRLAWYRKLGALFSLFRANPSDHHRELFTDFLQRSRVSFPYDEWTHQMHGHYLEATGRHHEAYVEFLEASRIDPSDSNNKQSMGECQLAGSDFAGAESRMLEALALDPTHRRAVENLAGVYSRQLEALAEDSLDDDLWSTRDNSDAIATPIEREGDEIAARARYFSAVALAERPDNPYNHHVAASVATCEGELEGALSSYKKAIEIAPDRYLAHLSVAHLLLALKRPDEALEVAENLVDKAGGWSEAWLLLADVHRACARHDDAQEVLVKGAGALQSNREELVVPLFEASKSVHHSSEAAGSVVRELAEGHWNDGAFMRAAAYTLDRKGQRGHAIALMRHVLAQSPNDLQTIFRLGSLLSEDVTTKDEGRILLEKACEYAPDSPVVRVKLAWLCWPGDPATGLSLLEPVLDAQDSNVYETAAALARAAGDEARAFEMARLAAGAFRTEAEAHIRLGWYQINGNRYELALAHAEALRELELEGEDVQEAEDLDYTSHRMAGRISELHPRASERCRDEVPEHLAFDVYYAFRSVDPKLAARGALVVAASKTDDDERLEWRSHAAGRFALAGDFEMLDAIGAEIENCAAAQASISWEYAELDRYADADQCAARALELEPDNLQVLAAAQQASLRQGNLEQAMGHASRALELFPYQHVGNERLALLYAKQFDVEAAMENSLRAIDLAPFCHVSLNSRAVSLIVAGELDNALTYATRSLGLEPATDDNEDNDALMIVRAVERDAVGLKKCIEEHRTAYPSELFGKYHDYLLEIAQRDR